MTQTTKKEMEEKLRQIESSLSPEDKLDLLKELNKMLHETNIAMEDFIHSVKEEKLKQSIKDSFNS